jgi:hypothetical protein
MVSDVISCCVCGGRIGLDLWQIFDHITCRAPRPQAMPAPPERDQRVLREKRRVYKLMEQLKAVSQRQRRHRWRR